MPTTTAQPKAKAPAAKRPRKPQTKNGRVAPAKSSDTLTLVQRPLWIAVGAVALATDAVQDFLDESLKRGKKLEQSARKELKKGVADTRKTAKATRQKAKKGATKKLAKDGTRIADRVLHALEIPTHSDLVSLEKKVNALAKKVA